tara:strand:- start:4256 stop:4411 length:156 start_codon:yes stop_codon:yes gene_type:complete
MEFANIPIETAKQLIQAFSFESQLVKNWSVEQTRNVQIALETIEFPVEEEV